MPLHPQTLEKERWLTSYALRNQQSTSVTGERFMLELQEADAKRKHLRFKEENLRFKQRRAEKEDKIGRKEFQRRLNALRDEKKDAEAMWLSILQRLPNYVDSDVFQSYPTFDPSSPFQNDATMSKQSASCVDDNFPYELQLYERLSPRTTALSLEGLRMTDALWNYFVSTAPHLTLSDSDPPLWNLPCNLSIHKESMLRFLGEIQQPNEALCDAPSWMSFMSSSEGLPNRSFLDRQLSHSTVLTGAVTSRSLLPAALIEGDDPKRGQSWFHQLAADRYIRVLHIAGPSLKADSRPLQMSLVEKWRTVLMKLVQRNGIQDEESVELNILAVSPSQLRHFESSRLILQAQYHTSGTAQYTKKYFRYSSLISISNFEDYVSTDLKHASTSEPLHVLLVEFAPMSIILDWVAHTLMNDTQRLPVPMCLNPWIQRKKDICIKRQVLLGKNGKRSVKTIQHPRDASTVRTPIGFANLTDAQLQAEALSCPFEFLPLFRGYGQN